MKTPLIILSILISLASTVGKIQAFDVCIDLGHGGDAPGAPTYIPGFTEDSVNLMVGRRLKELLDWDPSHSYVFTRLTDTELTLWDRAIIANKNQVCAFVSIHHNGDDNPNTQYRRTYYSNRTTTAINPEASEEYQKYCVAGRTWLDTCVKSE